MPQLNLRLSLSLPHVVESSQRLYNSSKINLAYCSVYRRKLSHNRLSSHSASVIFTGVGEFSPNQSHSTRPSSSCCSAIFCSTVSSLLFPMLACEVDHKDERADEIQDGSEYRMPDARLYIFAGPAGGTRICMAELIPMSYRSVSFTEDLSDVASASNKH